MGLLPRRSAFPIFFAFLFFAVPLRQTGPSTIYWAAPAILISAMMIAWAAESAQYFIAQGLALAILAWMQTLPEFAVEAVLAWKQQVPLLLASLTGALRLLTGLGWPVIYFTASLAHRRKHAGPLCCIRLEPHQSVEVIGLLVPLIYVAVIAVKGTLTVYDAAVLALIYAAYLAILSRLPAEGHESVDELPTVPRTIVKSPRLARIAMIGGLFVAGGLLIYYSAEPFLASLLAIATLAGIPNFIFIQWVAPIVSEFPEMASTVYFARSVDRAPMALMNMVSRQHQSMDAIDGDAAGAVFDQRGSAVYHSVRRSAEVAVVDDAGPGAGGIDVSDQHGAGLVGSGGVVHAIRDRVGNPLGRESGDGGIFPMGGGGVGANDSGPAEGRCLGLLPRNVERARKVNHSNN